MRCQAPYPLPSSPSHYLTNPAKQEFETGIIEAPAMIILLKVQTESVMRAVVHL